MGKVIKLAQSSTKPPVVAHFGDVKDPEGTGDNCAVLAAVMEDSLGGADQDRIDHAMETCGCDLCS